MSVKKVREEDSQGNVIYKETSSDMVVREDGTTVEDGLKEAEAPTFDDTGTVSGINSFQTFYQSIVSKMPFINFLRNFKAGLNFIVNTGQIVNNGAVNQPGYVLDARQRNPNIEGTLAYEVSQLTNGLALRIKESDFYTEQKEQANISLEGNGTDTLTFNMNKDGYRLIGIVGYTSVSSYIAITRIAPAFLTATVTVDLRNLSSNQTGTTIRIVGLYIKLPVQT